jgi:hypothetical protein
MAEILAEAAVETLAEGVLASTLAPEKYSLDRDPAIKGFTWSDLLEYNKSFLRGEKKTTFYHAGPLFVDQVPVDLIKLHDLGVFTDNGQGTQLAKGYDEVFYEVEQRAYLNAYMPIQVARKFIREARKDPEVIFEVSQIRNGKQLYLSDEIRAAWADPGYVSLTRDKGAATEEALAAKPWSDFTTQSEPMAGLYDMERKKFKNWYNWVCDGLCYVFIVDKEYGQEPKSMAERLITYLMAAGGGGRTKRRKRLRRQTKRS